MLKFAASKVVYALYDVLPHPFGSEHEFCRAEQELETSARDDRSHQPLSHTKCKVKTLTTFVIPCASISVGAFELPHGVDATGAETRFPLRHQHRDGAQLGRADSRTAHTPLQHANPTESVDERAR